MRGLFSLALVTIVMLCGVQAQAAPVALHYDLQGFDNLYGPPGSLGVSFDLYYDPTLLGSVSDNGGIATNGHFFYTPVTYYGPYNTGFATQGSFTSVTATISRIVNKPAVPVPPDTLQIMIRLVGPNAGAYTGLFILPDGSTVFNNFAFGIQLGADGVSHFSESQQVQIGAVPEVATWATMMMGLSAMGVMLRRRRTVTTRVAYA